MPKTNRFIRKMRKKMHNRQIPRSERRSLQLHKAKHRAQKAFLPPQDEFEPDPPQSWLRKQFDQPLIKLLFTSTDLPRSPWFGCLPLMIVLFLFLISISCFILVDAWNLATHGFTATGTILDVQEELCDHNVTKYNYLIGFTTSDYREVIITDDCDSTIYQPGAKIPIRYNPNNPHKAIILTFWNLLGHPILFFLFSSGGCLAFLFISINQYRKIKEKS